MLTSTVAEGYAAGAARLQAFHRGEWSQWYFVGHAIGKKRSRVVYGRLGESG